MKFLKELGYYGVVHGLIVCCRQGPQYVYNVVIRNEPQIFLLYFILQKKHIGVIETSQLLLRYETFLHKDVEKAWKLPKIFNQSFLRVKFSFQATNDILEKYMQVL